MTASNDIEINRSFLHADRYTFDFGPCRGWCQIDSRQDAPWYGQWCDVFGFKIFQYVEGDCIETRCGTEQAFLQELERLFQWHAQSDGKPAHLDPGNQANAQRCVELGLWPHFHECDKSLYRFGEQS